VRLNVSSFSLNDEKICCRASSASIKDPCPRWRQYLIKRNKSAPNFRRQFQPAALRIVTPNNPVHLLAVQVTDESGLRRAAGR